MITPFLILIYYVLTQTDWSFEHFFELIVAIFLSTKEER